MDYIEDIKLGNNLNKRKIRNATGIKIFYYITKNKKLTNQDKAKILQNERSIRKIPYITYSKRYKKFYSYTVYTKKYKEFIKNITEQEIDQML